MRELGSALFLRVLKKTEETEKEFKRVECQHDYVMMKLIFLKIWFVQKKEPIKHFLS